MPGRAGPSTFFDRQSASFQGGCFCGSCERCRLATIEIHAGILVYLAAPFASF